MEGGDQPPHVSKRRHLRVPVQGRARRRLEGEFVDAFPFFPPGRAGLAPYPARRDVPFYIRPPHPRLEKKYLTHATLAELGLTEYGHRYCISREVFQGYGDDERVSTAVRQWNLNVRGVFNWRTSQLLPLGSPAAADIPVQAPVDQTVRLLVVHDRQPAQVPDQAAQIDLILSQAVVNSMGDLTFVPNFRNEHYLPRYEVLRDMTFILRAKPVLTPTVSIGVTEPTTATYNTAALCLSVANLPFDLDLPIDIRALFKDYDPGVLYPIAHAGLITIFLLPLYQDRDGDTLVQNTTANIVYRLKYTDDYFVCQKIFRRSSENFSGQEFFDGCSPALNDFKPCFTP